MQKCFKVVKKQIKRLSWERLRIKQTGGRIEDHHSLRNVTITDALLIFPTGNFRIIITSSLGMLAWQLYYTRYI